MGETTGPRKGEAVYDEERYYDDEQPNGVIVKIDWESHEAVVEFHDDKKTQKSYSWDDMDWDRRHRGHWRIHCEAFGTRPNIH